jgi:hypothetical protein
LNCWWQALQVALMVLRDFAAASQSAGAVAKAASTAAR